MEGLQEEIRHIVKMLNPYSLNQVVVKARFKEMLLNASRKKDRSTWSKKYDKYDIDKRKNSKHSEDGAFACLYTALNSNISHCRQTYKG